MRVRLPDSLTAELVTGLLSVFPKIDAEAVPAGNTFTLLAGADGLELRRTDQLVSSGKTRAEIVLDLLTAVNRLVIDVYSGFAVHAGVVALGRRAVALPGASGAGKSTLTAACVMEGFDYVSDEALCVGFDSGRVHPYPRPLQLQIGAFPLLGLQPPPAFATCSEAALTAPQLGGRPARGDRLLREVVFMDRRPGPARLSEVRSSQTAGDLLRLSFNHYKRPARSFELAAQLAQASHGWVLTFEDPLEGAHTLYSAFA